jgi:LysM repeat protein
MGLALKRQLSIWVISTIFFLVSLPGVLALQSPMTIGGYIETYRTIAMQEMRRYGVPASIKLAQGILESGFGNSELALKANNHFGIKCHGWNGPGYLYDDDARDECFRKYNDPVESFLDHTHFLRSRPRYAFLFDLDPRDYKAWAYGLRTAGYATNPNYPAKLIRVIEEHNLAEYDRWALDLTADLPPSVLSIEGYAMVDGDSLRSSDFFPVLIGPRVESTNNRIRYVVARRGDTPESLAREFDMRPWQIIRYNEMEDGQQILAGQFIYLQPKRRRGTFDYHDVRTGETMYLISQQYGIRLDQLYRRNAMEPGEKPVPGQRLLLRGRVRR